MHLEKNRLVYVKVNGEHVRLRIHIYISDPIAGKKQIFQQLSSLVPGNLLERMTPMNAPSSHVYTSRKHFASQLGVQMALHILRGGDYPSAGDFLFSSSGHVRFASGPSYSKSTFLEYIWT